MFKKLKSRRINRQTAEPLPLPIEETEEESEAVIDGANPQYYGRKRTSKQILKRRGRVAGQTYTPPPMLVEIVNKGRNVVYPIREQIRAPINAKFPGIPLVPKVIKLPATTAPITPTTTRTKHLSHPIDI